MSFGLHQTADASGIHAYLSNQFVNKLVLKTQNTFEFLHDLECFIIFVKLKVPYGLP